MFMCVHMYIPLFFSSPPPALYLSFCTFISVGRFLEVVKKLKLYKPVDDVIADHFVHKMAKKWGSKVVTFNFGDV